uniref:Helix-turn-helix domain-containing protein n=1 Tax=uncultured prokaryote TaxID=198431 RepID=A0A0H5Q591_9ZZZZ|nr:hypothetical protein [uncultured prokaryote]
MDAQPSQAWLIEVPSRAIRKTLREEWQAYSDDSEREKGLVLASIAGKLLGVHKSRVYQLLDSGRLTRFEHFGHQWLSAGEIMDRLTEQPRAGRPPLAKAA